MATNDHLVPQMYLRRFAERRRKQHLIGVSTVNGDAADRSFESSVKNVAARTNYYWGTTADGVPHHHVEELLTKIESTAAHAFRSMLDDSQYALPKAWPTSGSHRRRMAWWLAAQLLRTHRQRRRLQALTGGSLTPPNAVGAFAANNPHLEYIVSRLAVLARILYLRPWCLAFSDACLITSDVPILVLNGQDEERQELSAAFWTVVVPLDPHRLLLLPGKSDVEDDPKKRADHRAKFDGGLGLFFNQALFDAADRHVFFHPEHRRALDLVERTARLPPADAPMDDERAPRYALSYGILPPQYTVERRWLEGHI